MRLQFSPLVLCLFLAIFLKNGIVNATNSSCITTSNTTENKVFTTISASVLNSIDGSILDSNSGVKILPIDSAFHNELIGVENDAISLIEENSYKFNVTNSVGIATISEKNQISLENASQQLMFSRGLYHGFAIMVILLNLVCFFLFEEKIFLFYSLALAGIIATFFYNDGLFSIIGIDVTATTALESTLLLVAIGFSAVFASKYLTLQEFFPKLKRATISLLILAGMFAISSWFLDEYLFATIANTMLFGVMVLYFSAGVLLFSKKNYAKFYVIASCIPLLFAIDFFVLKNLGIDFLATETSHLKAATLIEMLILTYAIMYRMRAIKDENELRQTELRIFLKRQEDMNRENAMRLVEEQYLENLIMHYDLDGLEIKLLQYISEGKTNTKIARKLKTTEIEIEELTKELYEKLEIGEHIQEDYRLVNTQPDYIYN